jgi:hypothetical protein
MIRLNLDGVHPAAAERVRPFLQEMAEKFPELILAMYVTGSAVTPDFNDATSDVNTFLVMKEIPLDIDFLSKLAPLGRKYGKRRVRAPLLMTPHDIERSLDVFPVEFFDLKLVNFRVMGEEFLAGIQVTRPDMRAQCERELRSRILRLRQDYIQSLGDEALLTQRLVASLAGLIPLLRGALFALGKDTPRDRAGIMAGLRNATGCETDGFEELILIKAEQRKPRIDTLQTVFEKYLNAFVRIADAIDAAG